MSDAMVVARMTQEKKDAVAHILSGLGTNASSAINQLYDYIERTGRLPFGEENSGDTREQRAVAAAKWLAGLSQLPEGNAFQSMDDDEIRAMRLQARRAKWEAAQ